MGPPTALVDACPSGVFEARPLDSVCGTSSSFVATPQRVAEAAAIVRAAGELKMSIVPRGAGTKLDWGVAPDSLDLVLDLSAMNQILEHEIDDLVIRVEAGCRLGELQQVLAEAGQRLPVDEMVHGSTVGGAVATGLCGPLRHRFGAVRDMVLGVSFVRSDGVLAKSGSKVVKNVAGYDLAKLLTGSYGTLGVLTEVIFRVRPLPHHEAFVVAVADDADDAGRRLSALRSTDAAPSAIEVRRDGPGTVEIAVLLEGAGDLGGRVEEISALLGPTATTDARPDWWGTLPGVVTVKVAVPRSAVPRVLDSAHGQLSEGTAPLIIGSAGVGVLFCGLDHSAGSAEAAMYLGALRDLCRHEGGNAVVLRAPADMRGHLDIWGPVEGLELMRRVKTEFDPERRLSPGRFVGGI